MGKAKQGAWGAVQGSVNNLIYSSWKGIPYVRAKPAVVRNPRTAAQQSARGAFARVQALVAGLPELVRMGFAAFTDGRSAYNAAMSYNLKHAVHKEGKNSALQYHLLSFSEGNYAPLSDCTATQQQKEVVLTWNPQVPAGEWSGRPEDWVAVVAVNEEHTQPLWLPAVALRSHARFELQLPDEWLAGKVHFWLYAMRPGVSEKMEDSVSKGGYVGIG